MLTVSWELFIAVIPRLAFVGFKFSQPFLLLRIVAAVTSGDTHGSLAHGLVAATALVFFGISVSNSFLVRATDAEVNNNNTSMDFIDYSRCP